MTHPPLPHGIASEETERDLLVLIIGCLVARDWTTDRIVKNTVTKMLTTVVAPKQADIWVARSRESDRYLLTGQYSTCWAWIPFTAGEREVAHAVDDYLARVEHAIGETYAVRPLKHRAPQPGV